MATITETAARKLLLHGGAAGNTVTQGVVADVGGISLGLWEMVTGLFTDILAYLFSALAGAAHLLVLPLEFLWKSLVTAVTTATGSITTGLHILWHHVAAFFAAIAGVFVLPLETLWALLAGATQEIPRKVAELWRWLQDFAAVALPFVLVVALLLLVAALFWFCLPALVRVGQALVTAACYFWNGLLHVGLAVHAVLAFLLPPCAVCLNCCAVVTMKAPGAAGWLISRAAFEAAPALYFVILRAAPPVVAATVFCSQTVAWLVAAPVAALFRAG